MSATPSAPPADGVSSPREQRAWYFYDWANSAYVTTTGAVLFAPYLTSVAQEAACGPASTYEGSCTADLDVLGLAISPGSLVFYLVPIATILSAILLPIVGAVADRSPSKRTLMARFAWVGALAASCMFFVSGGDWQLGAVLLVVANVCLGSSLVVYDAILCDVAEPDERDRVSSRGWALGYAAGALLLSLNLALVTFHESVGIGEGTAVRVCLLSAGVWWGAFTLVPYLGLRDRPPRDTVAVQGGVVARSFGQLWTTLRELRNYPQTLLFLLAYLLYNDGIQTVIGSAAVYGQEELGFETSFLITAILLVQFVAVAGALLFGRLAGRFGSRRTIMGGLVVWVGVVSLGYVLPAGQMVPFLGLAALIGLVMGGTQALSRSFYSLIVPRGREAEYFSLYQACERGTSWFGFVVFGVVQQLTDSYRPAIFALVVFFVGGLLLLSRVDPGRAIVEAGNTPPRVV
ncbi:MFS transporter [Solicola sp. PLA-1-18]|uniref:MFS transporter n=1 Tax=Solicola sp. PLA-1-18 TaxID=3380532 RepID=UPI003B7FFF2E